MELNIWLQDNAKVFIGGDPTKNQPPVVTTILKKPQIIVDKDNNRVVIMETK
jgi:hypothetical protein